MVKITYIHNDVKDVDRMQKEYYKQHQDKFPNIVDVWKVDKDRHLKEIELSSQ